LSARQLTDATVAVPVQPDERQSGRDLRVHLAAAHAAHAERETDVLGYRHVREKGIALEDHTDPALVGRKVRDVPAANVDRAAVGRVEAGNCVQDRGLAATARSEKRHELARRDIERRVVHGDHGPVGLAQSFDMDLGADAVGRHATSSARRSTPNRASALRARFPIASSTDRAPAAAMLPKLITVPPEGRFHSTISAPWSGSPSHSMFPLADRTGQYRHPGKLRSGPGALRCGIELVTAGPSRAVEASRPDAAIAIRRDGVGVAQERMIRLEHGVGAEGAHRAVVDHPLERQAQQFEGWLPMRRNDPPGRRS
jgi:hypothetical protein